MKKIIFEYLHKVGFSSYNIPIDYLLEMHQ